MLITIKDIEDAHARIREYLHETPVLTSSSFEKEFTPGKRVHFKCENFQKTGSFKARGALNSVIKLHAEQPNLSSKGVLTRSSGNFGAGLAYAASLVGLDCHVACPVSCSPFKMGSIEKYGGKIHLYPKGWESRNSIIPRLEAELGAYTIFASVEPASVSGHGTVALEILNQVPDVDAVIVPSGSGGLLAGISTAMKNKNNKIKVYGVEHDTSLNLKNSFQLGEAIQPTERRDTICDGISNTSVTPFALEHILEYVDDIIQVPDTGAISALVFLLESMKIMTEPTAALAAAALMQPEIVKKYFSECQNIVVVLTGGNFDILKKLHLLGETQTKISA